MDVRGLNMDQFNVISLYGSDHRVCQKPADPSRALSELDSQTRRNHFRHFVNWVMRAAVSVTTIYVGLDRVGDHWGDALAILARDLLIEVEPERSLGLLSSRREPGT